MPALRVTYIDIARGLAIIAMVVGHCIGFGLGRDLIFAWHMPLFVLVSGMFITEGTSLRKVLARNVRKLLLPYAVLELAEGAPLLLLEDRILSPSGQPFEYTRVRFRGDQVKLKFSINAETAAR